MLMVCCDREADGDSKYKSNERGSGERTFFSWKIIRIFFFFFLKNLFHPLNFFFSLSGPYLAANPKPGKPPPFFVLCPSG